MKQLMYYSIMAAVIFGAAISCAKEDPAPVNEQVPEDTNTPVSGTNVWSFSASIENPGTKVTSELSGDGFVFNWEASVDVVKVIWDGGSTTGAVESVTEGTATFSFTGLPADGTDIWLVYPSTLVASLEDGNLKIAMPEALKSDNHACYLVAKANVGDALVNFKHPVSYYRMTVDGDSADITKLTMSVTSGNITATHLTIAFDGSNEISTITPVSGTGSVDVTMNGTGTYYIPVVPGLALNKDSNPLLFQFFRGEAPAGGVYYKKTVTFERAATVNFGNLPTTATNRYVSTSGSGENNGTSWEKAWSLAQLESFLSGSLVSGDKLVAMDGVTIHLEEGKTFSPSATIFTNTLGDDSHKLMNLTIDGGTGTTLDGGGSQPIVGQGNYSMRDGTKVVFKNITFANGNRSGDGGGACMVGRGTYQFDNCTFTGNQSGKKGGAIHLYNTANLILNDCSFTGNHATNTGGALHMEGTTTATIIGCTFDGNYTTGTGSSDGGGAINVGGSTSKIYLNKCLFKDNYSNVGAALTNYSKGGKIYMNACAFTGNHITATYGVVIALRSGTDVTASLFMNNITMADNQYAKSGATGQQSCWINLNGLTKFVLSNSSLIGCPRNAEGAVNSNSTNPNLLRFDGAKGSGSNYHWLINNIIAITADSGTFYSCDLQGSYVKSYNNKLSALKDAGNFSREGNGTGTNFWGNTTSFAGLEYHAGNTWNTCYWSRSGGSDTSGTDGNVDKQKLENVSGKINTADSGFYNWLNDIGALDKDGRGHARSSYSWPGAYNN